jgi:hemerythrin-like domain-containing protein
MDIYESIKADHDKLREMSRQLMQVSPEGRRRVFDEFKRELWAHSRIEETVFYTPLRERGPTRMEILEGLNEHHMIDALLSELEAQPLEEEAWKAKAQVLGELLKHHLEEEEEELFEEARKVLDASQAETMAESWGRRKRMVVEALTPMAQ